MASKVSGLGLENYPSSAINNLGNVVLTGSYNSSHVNAYNPDGSCGLTLNNTGDYDSFIIKYGVAELYMGNPKLDGQLKVITRNEPAVLINTSGTVNDNGNTISIEQYKSVIMMWDYSKYS